MGDGKKYHDRSRHVDLEMHPSTQKAQTKRILRVRPTWMTKMLSGKKKKKAEATLKGLVCFVDDFGHHNFKHGASGQ